jgi:hypothetical protein
MDVSEGIDLDVPAEVAAVALGAARTARDVVAGVFCLRPDGVHGCTKLYVWVIRSWRDEVWNDRLLSSLRR